VLRAKVAEEVPVAPVAPAPDAPVVVASLVEPPLAVVLPEVEPPEPPLPPALSVVEAPDAVWEPVAVLLLEAELVADELLEVLEV